jgi:hypothetical protein
VDHETRFCERQNILLRIDDPQTFILNSIRELAARTTTPTDDMLYQQRIPLYGGLSDIADGITQLRSITVTVR